MTARRVPETGAAPPISPLFLGVTALFVTCLITANIIAVKLVQAGPFVLPAAVIIFPLSYILGDVLTEVYGFARARRVIWLGFFCNLTAVAAIVAAGALPSAPFWKGQAAYETILGVAPRILGASFLAYLAGEFANSVVLARMKVATGGRWLWTRTIGSTVVGQGLDSALFMTVAFAGVIPGGALGEAVVVQWAAKTLYEIAATPLTYLLVTYLKRREGVDVYDRDTSFNPLLIFR